MRTAPTLQYMNRAHATGRSLQDAEQWTSQYFLLQHDLDCPFNGHVTAWRGMPWHWISVRDSSPAFLCALLSLSQPKQCDKVDRTVGRTLKLCSERRRITTWLTRKWGPVWQAAKRLTARAAFLLSMLSRAPPVNRHAPLFLWVAPPCLTLFPSFFLSGTLSSFFCQQNTLQNLIGKLSIHLSNVQIK